MTVSVSVQFHADYQCWSDNRLKSGQFSEDEMDVIKDMLRRDLTPDPETLR